MAPPLQIRRCHASDPAVGGIAPVHIDAFILSYRKIVAQRCSPAFIRLPMKESEVRRRAALSFRLGYFLSADVSVDTSTGLCIGSRRRFLQESIENGSGGQGNHCHGETRNDENTHDLSPAATAKFNPPVLKPGA
jgi:hypothetical protein